MPAPVATLLYEPATRCSVLQLQPELVSVTLTRHWVVDVLGCWDLPRQVVRDCELVASELAANAVVHAATPFEVGVGLQGSSLVGSVGDGSLDVPEVRALRALDVGGRGLRIVDCLVDALEVDVCESGKVVHFRIDRDP